MNKFWPVPPIENLLAEITYNTSAYELWRTVSGCFTRETGDTTVAGRALREAYTRLEPYYGTYAATRLQARRWLYHAVDVIFEMDAARVSSRR